MNGIVASAEITIAAAAADVWAALTDPAQIKEYMFGSTVETDWQPGGSITWSGEYNGQPYQDKGEIITVEPPRRLEVTHFSPMTAATAQAARRELRASQLRTAAGNYGSAGSRAIADVAGNAEDELGAARLAVRGALESRRAII